MAQTINPELTVIPDQAEVWFVLKSDVVDAAALAAMTPTTADDDLEALGWEEVGLIDNKKGIPLDPSGEIKEYDAFGHPIFRTKFFRGKLTSGFTALEWNTVTRKFVLPGSAADKIGAPRDIQGYVLYRFVDEERATCWMALRPAMLELKDKVGLVEGELSSAEIVVHHTNDSNNDVFQIIDYTADDVTKTFTIDSGVTAYTATVDGQITASITTKTAAALQAALRLLSTVQALDAPGVVVTGPTGGPLVAAFTGTVTTVTASGTGGTVTVA